MSDENLNKRFNWSLMMLFISVFQILTSTPVIFGEKVNVKMLAVFAAYIALEWFYFFVASVFCGQNNFELETIGFLFSGIGLTVSASVYDEYALKQLFCIILGLAVFIVMLLVLRRTDVVMALRMPVSIAAIILLCINLALAEYNNGALNWITIAGFSIQPSELVKLAFIFVGAASLDKLQSARSLTGYLIFSFTCVGALFLMRDFGTALIFFFTFVIIAFMRSGDVRTIALVCVAAALGAIMIIYFRPTVAARFSTYRHIWEHINDTGMQQTRVLIYSASGGLLGLGVGNGMLRDVYAATTDLVFGMLCEEWGMMIAFTIVITYAFILFYAIRVARRTRSAFYAIASCAAAGLMLFQASLNIFGVTDLLPLTGVTLPFISRGGSSMICSWGIFAFIKAADIRTYPKLSKTILPDHPLYPPDIKIGRRQKQKARTVSPLKIEGEPVRSTRNNAVNPPTVKRISAQPPVKRNTSSSHAKDIPVSRAKRKPQQSQPQQRRPKQTGSVSGDIPISRRSSSKGRNKQ